MNEELREQFIAKYPQCECESTIICKNESEFQTKIFPFYELCRDKFGIYAFGFFWYDEEAIKGDKEIPGRLEKICQQYAETPDNRQWAICYCINMDTREWFILTTIFYRRHLWSEEELYEKIDNNDLQALLALERLFECQTAEEIATGQAIERNNKGLNGYDAGFLTKWWKDTVTDRGQRMGIKTYLTEVRKARTRLKAGERGVSLPNNPLSQKQMDCIRKILRKYRRQLLQMVNG